MIGDFYWATGIIVHHVRDDDWHAEALFCDAGFAELGSSEVVVRSRYVGPLSTVIDIVKADAERLGLKWVHPMAASPYLYYRGDGESREHPPPRGWRQRMADECVRLGWTNIYKDDKESNA